MELGNTRIERVGRDTIYKKKQQSEIPRQVAQDQTQQRGGYGEELKQQLQTLGDVRRKAPVIQAKRVNPFYSEPEQYTKDAVKTAMKELEKFIASRGLGGEDKPGDYAQTTPFAGGGGGGGFFSGDNLGNLSYKNMPFVPQDQYKGVETDNLRYGDTMPEGAFGIGSKATDDFTDRYPSTAGDFDREKRGPIANLPSDYKQTEQRAFDEAEAYRALVASGLDKTVSGEDAQVNVGSGSLGSFGLGTAGKGAPSGASLPSGSFGSGSIKTIQDSPTSKVDTNISRHTPGTSKDQPSTTKPQTTTTTFGGAVDVAKSLKNIKAKQEAPKQTVASLPSNYKSTEAAAFAKAKSYKDSKAKGDAAAKATNTPSKPPAGSFGISEAGRKEAEANKAAAQAKKAAEAKAAADAKAKADAKAAADKKAKQAEAKKKAEAAKKQQQASKPSSSSRKSGSKKSSRGGSKSGGGSKGGSKSGGSKGTSGSKKGSRGTSGSRSKGGTSKGGARTNRRRSRRRCDIRCKFDISILTNQNLIRDDLADVAYFVKDLQEIN